MTIGKSLGADGALLMLVAFSSRAFITFCSVFWEDSGIGCAARVFWTEAFSVRTFVTSSAAFAIDFRAGGAVVAIFGGTFAFGIIASFGLLDLHP